MDDNQSIQDKLRAALLKNHAQEQLVTIDALIGSSGLSYPQVYQGLYRLRNQNEIDIIKDRNPDTGKVKITGVKLLKMESLEKVNGRIQESAIKKETDKEIKRSAPVSSIPNLLAYMNAKIGVERARKVLMEHHVSNATITFDPDPLGEEGIVLLEKLEAKIQDNEELRNRLNAAERNLQNLRNSQPNAETAGKVPNPVGANN